MPASEAQKRASIRYREKNRLEYNLKNKVYNNKCYHNNVEKRSIYNKNRYEYIKQNDYNTVAKIFLRILLKK